MKCRKGSNPIFPSSLLVPAFLPAALLLDLTSVAVVETTTARLEKKSGNTGTKALINSNCSLARSKRYYGIPGLFPFYGYTGRFEDVLFFPARHTARFTGHKSRHQRRQKDSALFVFFFRPDWPAFFWSFSLFSR